MSFAIHTEAFKTIIR